MSSVPKDNVIEKEGFTAKMYLKWTSLPYFRVKLNCVCLKFAYIKKVMTYSDPMVTYGGLKVTYS